MRRLENPKLVNLQGLQFLEDEEASGFGKPAWRKRGVRRLERHVCLDCILDKESKTSSSIPNVEDKVFISEPRVKIKEPVDSEASVSADNKDLSVRDETNQLHLLFGTKKANNRDKKRHALNP